MSRLRKIWLYINNEKVAFYWFKTIGLLVTLVSVLSFIISAYLNLSNKVNEISLKVMSQEEKLNSISVKDLREHAVFAFINNELRTDYQGLYQKEWKNQLYDFNDYYNGLINECVDGTYNPYNDPYTVNFDNVDINVQRNMNYIKFRNISTNLGIYYILSDGFLNLSYHKKILTIKGKL